MHNIRFNEELYSAIRSFAQSHNWTFARVVGEACTWYLSLSPILQEAEDKARLLAGKPLVIGEVREFLLELEGRLDEALLEASVAVEDIITKE